MGTESFQVEGPILIVGCGLIGTSMAKALKAWNPELVVDGVEMSAKNANSARNTTAFRNVYAEVPVHPYSWGVLAVPISVACTLLPIVSNVAHKVADVCSVKSPICELARDLNLTDRFVPTHPMAGLATSGPDFADDALFRGQPWILLRDWTRSADFITLATACGARVEWLPNATAHDKVMSSVSHGIHLMSAIAMLAAHQTSDGDVFGQLTGPGFRDVTRLSASPEAFWVETLLSNRENVSAYLKHARCVLSEFAAALDGRDPGRISELLREARQMKSHWSLTGK